MWRIRHSIQHGAIDTAVLVRWSGMSDPAQGRADSSMTSQFGSMTSQAGSVTSQSGLMTSRGSRPPWMSRFMTVGWFTFFASSFSFFFGLFPLYTVSQVTTIEKHFDLSSQRSGMVVSGSEIGFILSAICVGYFLNHAHRPRILGYCTIAILAATLTATIPLYMDLYKGRVTRPGHLFGFNGTCRADEHLDCQTETETADVRSAFWVFLAAVIFYGIGSCGMWTIGLSYIDDNADKKQSYLLISLVMCIRFLSPVGGMLLGAAVAPVPVHIEYFGGSPDDNDWVGAWWIGYYVIFVLVFISSIPIWLYPKVLAYSAPPPTPSAVFTIANPYSEMSDPSTDSNQNLPNLYPVLKPSEESDIQVVNGVSHLELPKQNGDAVQQNGGEMQQRLDDGTTRRKTSTKQGAKLLVKGFPAAILRLLKNPIFMCACAGSAIDYSISVGYATFIPKYLEMYFHTTASIANLLTGVSLALSAAIGSGIGGYLMSVLKIRLNRMLLIALIVNIAMTAMVFPMTLLKCEGIKMVGITESAGLNTSCNSGCGCHTSLYNPVCDGHVAYYSPCHAGCTDKLHNGTFTHCSCASERSDIMVSGLCEKECSAEMGIYATMLFFMAVCLAAAALPPFMVTIRSIEEKDKALALAVLNVFTSIFAFPTPVIYGSLIDGVCLVLNQLLCEEGAACMFYDNESFKYRLHFLTLGLKAIPTALFFAAWFISRKTVFPGDEKLWDKPEVQEVHENPVAVAEMVTEPRNCSGVQLSTSV